MIVKFLIARLFFFIIFAKFHFTKKSSCANARKLMDEIAVSNFNPLLKLVNNIKSACLSLEKVNKPESGNAVLHAQNSLRK